jgi:phosphonate transport system substrate-binding protein
MRVAPLRRQHPSGRSMLVIVLVALCVSVIASVASWFVLVRRSQTAMQAESVEMLVRLTGLQRPVTNHLDARFTDADGDMIADPPTDSAALLDPPTLTFSYVPVEDATPFKDAWADFMKHLSSVTGKPVEYVEFETEADQLRAMRDGRLHVVGLNTGRVPIAVNACGFVPVAMLAESGAAGAAGGKTHTEIIVPVNSPIHDVRGLKGHELTLTEPGSNSGSKAPLVFLKEFNLLPGHDYLLRYSGSHDASIDGIGSGKYEAAAVAADVLSRAEATGRISKAKYRSIFQSEPFPTAGLGYLYNLKPELAAQIREALLKYPWPGTSMEKFFGPSGAHALAPVNYKDDWAVVRRIDDAIGYEHVVKDVPADATSRPATQSASK